MSGAVDEDVGADKLTIVFVGGEHVGGNAFGASLGGQGADNVVGLETIDLQHGYVHGL